MGNIFRRKRFSNYLGEERAIDDIIEAFIPDGGPSPTPTPSSTPVPPTPTPSVTPTLTPTPTIPAIDGVLMTELSEYIQIENGDFLAYEPLCSSFNFDNPSIAAFGGLYTQVFNGENPLVGYFQGTSSPYTFKCGTAPNLNDYAVFTGGISGQTMAYFSDLGYYRALRSGAGLVTSSSCNQLFNQTSILNINLPAPVTFFIKDGINYPYGNYIAGDFNYEYCNLVPSPSPTPTPSITPTLTPTPTATPVASFDPDAQTFFDVIALAGGSLTTTEKDATNQLVLDLKGYGLWSKMIGLYPVVGATAVEHQFNLADPTQYNLTFIGNWTHSTAGASPGVNGYARTNIVPSSINFQASGSCHYSMYITENLPSGAYDLGTYDSGGSGGDWGLISSFYGNNTAYTAFGDGWNTASNGGNTDAFWIGSYVSSTADIYKDGTSIVSVGDSISAGSNYEIVLSANNNNGSVGDFSQRDWALSSIGYGMNATEAANYNTAVVTFQTTLGRQN